MIATYKFIVDDSYFSTALKRYRRQHPRRHLKVVAPLLLVLIAVAALPYAWKANAHWIMIPEFTVMGALIGGIVGAVLGKSLRAKRLKASRDFGSEISMTLDDVGVAVSGTHMQAKFDWAAFDRRIRFKDGIMLLKGSVLRWLPDAMLIDAAPEEVTAFVITKTNVTDFV
jgi:hypothetical protein